MLETEKQPNNLAEISPKIILDPVPKPKKNKLFFVLLFGSILALLILGGYVFLKFSNIKLNSNESKITENKPKLTGLKPGLYTMDGTPLDLAEAQRIQQQSLEPKPVVLPDNFPIEYIPVKYKKLLSVAGTPNTSNAPYGAVFSSSGTIDETYNEAKKYFSSKNWTITELTDRKIPNNGKQIVAENKGTTIITTVAIQNGETAVTLNIISQSNAK
ncbi:MAG: hypothetical protein AAB729_02585 [Patescibacteria group bacterium]